jgi:hypothetical protein
VVVRQYVRPDGQDARWSAWGKIQTTKTKIQINTTADLFVNAVIPAWFKPESSDFDFVFRLKDPGFPIEAFGNDEKVSR